MVRTYSPPLPSGNRFGQAASPLDYTRQLQDLDIWHHQWWKSALGRLTLHEFAEFPKRILDVGCGTGAWILHAAMQQQQSKFVGFDIKNVQPDLFRVGLTDLASRVRWVHGSFLNPLPFPSDYFDFVRVHDIALNVPEDKWQPLLEEVLRILQPGCHLEITDQNLTFPKGPPLSSSYVRSPPTGFLRPLIQPSESNHSSEAEKCHIPLNSPIRNDTGSYFSEDSSEAVPYDVDPRDHSKLDAAWSLMLRSRFISPQPLSLLSFYLDSIFGRVDPLPLFHLRLPQNSGLIRREGEPNYAQQNYPVEMIYDAEANPPPSRKAWGSDPAVFTPHSPIPNSYAAISLARKRIMIEGCKEAIWSAWELLFDGSPGVCDGDRMPAREEFDFHWLNWVNDMTDRMGMGGLLASTFSWETPSLGDPTPSKTWRSSCGQMYYEPPTGDLGSDDYNLCYTARGFLAWKSSR